MVLKLRLKLRLNPARDSAFSIHFQHRHAVLSVVSQRVQFKPLFQQYSFSLHSFIQKSLCRSVILEAHI